jgi:hypothetical protein
MQRPAPLFLQNANNRPEPPLPGGFTATQTLCFLRSGGRSRNFVVLKLSGHVVQSRSFPPETENRPGTTTFPAKSAKRSINFCENGVKGKNAKCG